MVLMQMCNPQINNLDWIKMKGQLRLVQKTFLCFIQGFVQQFLLTFLFFNNSKGAHNKIMQLQLLHLPLLTPFGGVTPKLIILIG
jgi:hypothetical protein